jgi:DNA polymerase elongation subunit (family B)
LYKAFKETEKSGGRLLYCDTDSIFAAYDKKNSEKNTKNFN